MIAKLLGHVVAPTLWRLSDALDLVGRGVYRASDLAGRSGHSAVQLACDLDDLEAELHRARAA